MLKQRALERLRPGLSGMSAIRKASWFVTGVGRRKSVCPDATGHMYSN
jgi:hypothetical protein